MQDTSIMMLYTDVIRRTAVQVMKEEGVDKSGTQRDLSDKVCLTFKGNVSMTTVTYETWAGEKKNETDNDMATGQFR